MSTPRLQAAHATPERYQKGDVVGGKYQLLAKAGEGAMGAVWVATNTALESRVAIKMIHPEMSLPAIAERLLREARAAAMLTHSAIVRVFDLGETERGDPYIVMELLEGESLQALLSREGAMAPARAVSMILPIASAMQTAHERGIIHRDIKPDNIVLAAVDGGRLQPKIVDFGIAKIRWSDGGGAAATGGVMIGTPEYMSPEQAGSGAPVDHRADIWSLCAVLYEMLADVTPFPADNAWQILSAVIQDPVPSLEEWAIADSELWEIIERGLRKNPEERWQSMRELGVALAGWLASHGVHEDVCGTSLHAQWLDDRAPVHSEPPPRSQSRLAGRAANGPATLVALRGIAGRYWHSAAPRAAVAGVVVFLVGGLVWMTPSGATDAAPPHPSSTEPPALAEPSVAAASLHTPVMAPPMIEPPSTVFTSSPDEPPASPPPEPVAAPSATAPIAIAPIATAPSATAVVRDTPPAEPRAPVAPPRVRPARVASPVFPSVSPVSSADAPDAGSTSALLDTTPLTRRAFEGIRP